MAARIRLSRTGRRNRPFYRIGIYDARSKRDGKSIEILGTYDPRAADDAKVTLNEERAKYWLGVGAEPTEKVEVLLKKKGLL